MEFLTFHHEFVADLAANDKQNYFRRFYIIQHPQVAGAEFELRERIRSQSLDRARGGCRLLSEPGLNRGLKHALVTNGKSAQMRVGFLGDCNREGQIDLAENRSPRRW